MPAAARRLTGLTLDGGWKVIQSIALGPDATGSRFSAGYIVERGKGERAFLKALDYSNATLPGKDPAVELQRMTTEYLFERDLVGRCAGKGFSRIVRGIDHGRIQLGPGLDNVVEYIIFELAEGDIRRQMAKARQLDVAWTLRVLHHVATALFQLHGALIAHQDVKPSNVLNFGSNGSKLADLGRAAAMGQQPPHDAERVAGDPVYAPPELLYGEVSPDWRMRRVGCDLYHLGSLTCFLFCSANMTALLLANLAPDQHPKVWAGSFRDVMPYLRAAFAASLTQVALGVPGSVRDEIVLVVQDLCEPDPLLRGHLRDRRSVNNRYTCERYVSTFDRLARRAEYELKKGLA